MKSSAVAALLALALTGCAATAESISTDSAHTVGWADEFDKMKSEDLTNLEQQILADGVISSEELTAAESAFVTCAKLIGFTVSDFDTSGGYEIDGPFTENGPPELTRCESAFNRTSGMYWMMKRNPEGIDEAELMVACLIRAGVVQQNFTRSDYLSQLGTPPLTIGSAAFSSCNANPTTAFR